MAKITKQIENAKLIGTKELRPDSGFVAFIKKADQKVNNMPSWKKGILEASSQSSNLSERPSVNIISQKMFRCSINNIAWTEIGNAPMTVANESVFRIYLTDNPTLECISDAFELLGGRTMYVPFKGVVYVKCHLEEQTISVALKNNEE